MKRKLPEYVVEARKANAQEAKETCMGFIIFVLGIVVLCSLMGSFLR